MDSFYTIIYIYIFYTLTYYYVMQGNNYMHLSKKFLEIVV